MDDFDDLRTIKNKQTRDLRANVIVDITIILLLIFFFLNVRTV